MMEFILELSDSVVMQSKRTMYRVFHKKKNLATRSPVAKTLIKYNSKNLEENDEGVKEPIDIELTEQNTDPYHDENGIDFKWSDLQEEEDEEDIALTNLIESLQKKTDEENFSKSN